MRFELRAQLVFGHGSIFGLGTFGLGLGDGACAEAEFDLFAAFVVCDVGRGDAFHPEDLDFVAIAAGQRILYSGEAAYMCKYWMNEEEWIERTFLVRVCGLVGCGRRDRRRC